MTVLQTQSEFGHAPPLQTPYSVITNLPGWDVARAIRDGDPTPMKRIVHIYPRFLPTHYATQVSQLDIFSIMGGFLTGIAWP